MIIQGAPLLDDFLWCNAGEEGLARLLGHQVDNTGIVRPMRFPVASLIALSCTQLNLGLMIGLTLGLTIAAALLLVGLLRDLHVPGQWPYVGGALFLLFPLGAESALWPSAMHIPLGLCAALIALRLYLREKLVPGAAARPRREPQHRAGHLRPSVSSLADNAS